jgi:hypothetical protein
MTTNGNAQDRDVLAGIEQAIIGGRPPAMRPAEPPENSINTFIEDLADQYRALGRHALEHGQYLSQLLNEHADKLLSDNRRVTSLVLQAERKLVADAENFIGK